MIKEVCINDQFEREISIRKLIRDQITKISSLTIVLSHTAISKTLFIVDVTIVDCNANKFAEFVVYAMTPVFISLVYEKETKKFRFDARKARDYSTTWRG